MARKRGPGRPKLSAAEKAERKALREKEGRKTPGRKPGRPAGARGPRKPQTEYTLLVAELAERLLRLEAEVKASKGNPELENRVETVAKSVKELAEAHQVLADVAGKTEAKLATLCDNLNHYFSQLPTVGTPQEQEAMAVNQ